MTLLNHFSLSVDHLEQEEDAALELLVVSFLEV
jgi:hypothetical protein